VKRLLPAAAAVLALGLAAGALSSCNADWSPYAAKVGSTTISQATLEGYLSAISADTGYSCLVGASRAKGVGTSTYQASFVGFVLTQLIRAHLVEQVAARRHLAEPASAYGVAVGQLQQSIAQSLTQDPSCGTEQAVWGRLASRYRNELVTYQVAEDALAAAAAGTTLRPADLASFAASHPSLSRQDCISVIEVTKQSEAVTLRKAILGGASFATEAHKHSIDTGTAASGGAIGCVTPGQLVSPLGPVVSGLTVGTVSGPVKFQRAWLLLLVTSRHPESAAAIVAGLFNSAQRSFGTILDAAIRSTSVAVNPLYGSWSTAASTLGEVRPPKGPPARFVRNGGALEVAPSSATGTTPGG